MTGFEEHTSGAVLGIHSLQMFHVKGFLVHELDVEVAEPPCQSVTGFEEHTRGAELGIHSLQMAHMKGFLVHELDV